MKIGSFNINSYLQKLNENAEDGNLVDKEGLIIPDENKKTYDWLKKEYQQGQTEVKVEVSGSGSSFTKSSTGLEEEGNGEGKQQDFKPGMSGEAKTGGVAGSAPNAATKGEQTKDGKAPLDAKQGNPNFGKQEGNKPAPAKTNDQKGDIKNNNFGKKEGESKEDEKHEEHEKSETPAEEKKEHEGKKPEVKKIDLKTKK